MPNAFEPLLDVQEHDTAADQLRHRLAHLPARGEIEQVHREIADHERATAEVVAVRDELARGQRRIEGEVALVEAKVAEVDATLYGGSVTSPRELQALQDDLDSLRRRQRQLEDQVIEVMEQIEPIEADLAARDVARGEYEARLAALEAALVEAAAAIDAELEVVEAERAATVAGIDPALLTSYESLRRQLGGVAVARLVGSNCGGCHLSLSAVELDRIRHLPPDAAAHCEECGRLLVH